MTRVVVTGAKGFVGGFACRAITKRGGKVVAAGRSGRLPGGIDMEVHLAPDTSPQGMREVLEGATAVVHLAAAVHDVRGRTSVDEYFRVNRDYPVQLAEAAVDVGMSRFVFVSTIKVNGEGTRPGEVFDELSEVAPQGPYAESKWQAEEALRKLSATRSIQVRIVRPPLVYGPGVRANFLSLMRWVKSGVPLPFAGFDNARSLIYVDNLADVLARLAIGGGEAASCRTYLVCDGEDVSTAELVRRMAAALSVVPRLFSVPEPALRLALAALKKRGMADRLMGSLKVRGDLIRRELAWNPPFSLDEGLSLTAAWFLGQL